MNKPASKNQPELCSIAWQRERYEEDITDRMLFWGDEIMAELGRESDKFGVWSKEDLALLEKSAASGQVRPFIPE